MEKEQQMERFCQLEIKSNKRRFISYIRDDKIKCHKVHQKKHSKNFNSLFSLFSLSISVVAPQFHNFNDSQFFYYFGVWSKARN